MKNQMPQRRKMQCPVGVIHMHGTVGIELYPLPVQQVQSTSLHNRRQCIGLISKSPRLNSNGKRDIS